VPSPAVHPPAGLVVLGAGVALAVALPAALVAQVADALAEGDDGAPAALTYPLAGLVLLGAAVGGRAVGRHVGLGGGRGRAPALGGAAGLVAVTVVQVLGVARRLVADEDVAWGTIPVVLVVGAALAAGAAALASRRAGRTRP
jgi:hypothetical protein